MKSAIIYLRVSTLTQAQEGIGLEAQEQRCREYCAAHDMKVVAVNVDGGISGKRMDNRPELLKCLEVACKNKFTVVTYALSRMSRSVKDIFSITERLQKAGAGFASASEEFGSGAQAELMVGILGSLAQFERALIASRTKSALQTLKSQGKRVSGIAPYGYSIKGEDLKPNPKELAVVEVMAKLKAKGLAYRSVAKTLEAKKLWTRQGKTWTAGAILRILRRQEVPQAA